MQITKEDFVKYLTIKKGLRSQTVNAYAIRFDVIQRWLLDSSKQLTNESFEDFIYQLKKNNLSNAGINTYIQSGKHLESLYRSKGIELEFMSGIDCLPKVKSRIEILTVEEVKKLCKTELVYENRNGKDCSDLDRRYRTLTSFLAITGARFAEARNLKVNELELSNGRAVLLHTKNGENRFVYFEGPIKEELEYLIEGKKSDEYVFTNSKGEMFVPGDFNNDLRRRAIESGIIKPERLHAHLLRHSFATNLLVAGVDIAVVATLLGHKDIKTTYETYVHLADEILKRESRKNPLLRDYIEPHEIIKTLKEEIEKFKIHEDSRFKHLINETENSFKFEIIINQEAHLTL